MKLKALILFLTYTWLVTKTYTQDTFSIVAADSTTREVGSAGASCVDLFQAGFLDATFLGDLLPDTGAINTQASYLASNQNNARIRMRAGDTPDQIISWLSLNDVQDNSAVRQYGITGFTGNNVSAAGFTGTNCINYKNHNTGSIKGIYYSIQGNILLGQGVLDSMELRFKNAEGDLACRLMAAMQGANIVGADTRCNSDGTSSLFAYLKVSQRSDPYGDPSFKISVRTQDNSHIEPIDSLQSIFDTQHSCGITSLTKFDANKKFKIYPNPAGNEIVLNLDPITIGTTYIITDSSGKQIITGIVTGEFTTIDIHSLVAGLYIIQMAGYSQTFIKE